MKKISLLFTALVLSLFVFVFLSFRDPAPRQGFDLKASIARGKEVYISFCLSCHMEDGNGIENTNPPLAKADYLMADKNRAIRQVLKGAKGEMKVNGKIYNVEMTGFDLNDEQASDVVNYIRNSWGNKGGAVTPADVKAQRN
jgi:nitrite reductase (NO-forming)